MKTAALVLIALVGSAGMAAQQPRQKMSLAFTTSSLQALRNIGAYDGTEDRPGDRVSDGQVERVVYAVDDMARSKPELAVVGLLKQFLADKMRDNVQRSLIATLAWEDWQRQHPFAGGSEFERQAEPAVRSIAMARHEVAEMTVREIGCQVAIERMLRTGYFAAPRECLNIVVSFDMESERELIESGK